MQLTGQQVATQALTILGLNEQGGTPSVSDSTDALNELNLMWDAWGIDEDLIYAEVPFQLTWTANTSSYLIGPNATPPLNVPAPSRIYRAFFVDSNGVRTKIDITNAEGYFSHRDLTAAAKCPDELYPDFAVIVGSGSVTLYLFPVPNANGVVEIDTAAVFGTWTLGGTYNVPEGFADAIGYALAWRLIPRFGMAVDDKTAQVVGELGQKSEARIIKMNAINRQRPLPPAQAMPPGEK